MAAAVDEQPPSPASSGAMDERHVDQARDELHHLVSEFRAAAERGILVGVVSPENKLMCQGVFQVDALLQRVSLKVAFARERSFDPRDIVAIFKGREFEGRVPELASMSSSCFGLQLRSEAGEACATICFTFADTISRDEFFSCLKIIKMTVDSYNPQALSLEHWPTMVVSL